MTTLRTRMVLTAALLALTTAACGGDDGGGSASPPTGASASTSPSASPTPGPVTTPEASAAATKINLAAADLPGYTATPPDETTSSGSDPAEDAFYACVGASTAEPVAEFASDDFTKGMQLPALTIASSVAFVADAATVQKDLEAFGMQKAEGCVSTFFQQSIGEGEEGVTFGQAKATRLTPTAPGTDGSFGFRVTIEAETEGQKIPFTFDLLAYGEKRTTVSLSVLGVGTSVPEAERDALFAKLVERGTANAL